MSEILLFIFGTALGSFLNVLSVRYDPNRFLLSNKVIGGRSHCPKCRVRLKWFELIPIASFLFQLGRCNHCGKSISFQYPVVEILSGLIFVFAYAKLQSLSLLPITPYSPLVILWILVFVTLLLISLVDLRLSLIPDEANIFLAILGIFIIILSRSDFGPTQGSFVGPYSLIFGLRENIWLNHAFAALVALVIFGFLILITRGRGMGIGDLKLAIPLGLIFGWPDIIFIIGLGFIIGSIFGVYAIVFQKKKLKSFLPFGPFLGVAAAIIFFFGQDLVNFYFQLFLV